MAKVSAISAKLRERSESPKQASAVPTEQAGQSVKQLVDQVVAAKAAMVDAEAAYEIVESQLLGESGRIYAERAEAGNFAKSMNLDGEQSAGVQVVYTDKFSAIEAGSQQEEDLRKAVGKRFEALFEEKRTISLEKTDDATIELLMEKLGEKAFFDIFKIRVQVAAKKGFDEVQFELPAQVRETIKQAKGSVRLRKE